MYKLLNWKFITILIQNGSSIFEDSFEIPFFSDFILFILFGYILYNLFIRIIKSQSVLAELFYLLMIFVSFAWQSNLI